MGCGGAGRLIPPRPYSRLRLSTAHSRATSHLRIILHFPGPILHTPSSISFTSRIANSAPLRLTKTSRTARIQNGRGSRHFPALLSARARSLFIGATIFTTSTRTLPRMSTSGGETPRISHDDVNLLQGLVQNIYSFIEILALGIPCCQSS